MQLLLVWLEPWVIWAYSSALPLAVSKNVLSAGPTLQLSVAISFGVVYRRRAPFGYFVLADDDVLLL